MALLTREIHIQSIRLSLQPFTASDAGEAYGCITPTLARFMSWDPPANRASFDQIYQSWLTSMADGTDYVFAIRQRADDHFLGLAGLHHLREDSPELGIWIREDSHGHGFGREAVRLVAQWAAQTMPPASFTYPVAEQNSPSRGIAESLGGMVIDRCEKPKYTAVIYRIPCPPAS
ncbi:GNAT family N-acetyltransferase [Paludibacterium purpuratum]|uniref:RimJ/RimL family protein N-acetyltransferase n=1 Tax=Paludibacterium purpuratum TaxID=1144873 RepID=A0A4V3DVZ7_9NEIS|nr:GNAT family N-acetyltransferase [Paludibacterium purpuratum]TDR82699.1 RimJ/RimL family protein N-acetyltransferase [Paludibacterium purpuratum]